LTVYVEGALAPRLTLTGYADVIGVTQTAHTLSIDTRAARLSVTDHALIIDTVSFEAGSLIASTAELTRARLALTLSVTAQGVVIAIFNQIV
jgi:hypothetical protein